MVKARVLYWKEVPVQVQVQGDAGTVSRQLDSRFQQGVDAIAMLDGSQGADAYLEAWEWGDFMELDGGAEDAAERIAARFNERFPRDFVARIRGLVESGRRDPRPGAVDHWCEA